MAPFLVRFKLRRVAAVLLMALSSCASADIDDEFHKWSYRIRGWPYAAELTYISRDLIGQWLVAEHSSDTRERIITLRQTIQKHGYFVYFVHLQGYDNGNVATWTMSPTSRTAYLQITERSPTKYYPVAYSGNLDSPMSGRNDYYGVLVFKTPADEFAFQSVTIEVTRGPWRERCPNHDPRPCSSETKSLPFAFHPNGVPSANRGSSLSGSDILGVLRLVLPILRALPARL